MILGPKSLGKSQNAKLEVLKAALMKDEPRDVRGRRGPALLQFLQQLGPKPVRFIGGVAFFHCHLKTWGISVGFY